MIANDLPEWECSRCKRSYVDADEVSRGGIKALPRGTCGVEPREYWISDTEPICAYCAQELHLTA
jgi:hypothetical protein